MKILRTTTVCENTLPEAQTASAKVIGAIIDGGGEVIRIETKKIGEAYMVYVDHVTGED